MSIEALVQEDKVNQAVMEDERFLCSYEFQEKSPDTLDLALIALKEEELVNKS